MKDKKMNGCRKKERKKEGKKIRKKEMEEGRKIYKIEKNIRTKGREEKNRKKTFVKEYKRHMSYLINDK